MQVGLVEAALPLRRLARLLLALGAVCIVTVTVAMTIGVISLALAVIFAGTSRTLAEIPNVVAWFTLGVAVQLALWLAAWAPERRWFARRALANKLRADVRMLRFDTTDVPSLIHAHTESDVVTGVLRSAGFLEDQDRRLRSSFSASIVATRALIAWITLDQPDEYDRMTVGIRLEQQAQRLDGWLPRRTRIIPRSLPLASPAAEGLARSL